MGEGIGGVEKTVRTPLLCISRSLSAVTLRVLSRVIGTYNRDDSIEQFREQRRTSARLITPRLTMSNTISSTILSRGNGRLAYQGLLIRVGDNRYTQTYFQVKSRQLYVIKALNPKMRGKDKLNTADSNPIRPTIIIRPTRLVLRRSRYNRNQHIRHLVLTKVIRYTNR